MFDDFFDFIDEMIINEIFQPICDKIRTIFGWSKRIPSIAMKIVAIIGLFPLCVWLITMGGVSYISATVMLFWSMIQVMLIITLIREETNETESQMAASGSALDEYRVRGKKERKICLILSVSSYPFVLMLILLSDFSYEASFYLVGGIANLCDCFFRACTDLPKGKNVFARVRERLQGFAKQLVPQTT